MIGFSDDAYYYADDSFFRAWTEYENRQDLRDELDDSTAEENGYATDELDQYNSESRVKKRRRGIGCRSPHPL